MKSLREQYKYFQYNINIFNTITNIIVQLQKYKLILYFV